MRPRIEPEDKRTVIIGIKTKEVTKKRIKWISERDGRPMSSQINMILESYIENYLRDHGISYTEIDEE